MEDARNIRARAEEPRDGDREEVCDAIGGGGEPSAVSELEIKGEKWIVKDDFADEYEPSDPELDAIEAFLLPVVEAILAGENPELG
jgi:hypothetical protein